MKIRLHEIELGTSDVQRSKSFYQSVLDLEPQVEIEGLNVFDSGTAGLDLNTSNHFPQGIVAISFIVDDLGEIERKLKSAGISYEGPAPSHLGMNAIQFNDPDGYLIKINSPVSPHVNERVAP